MWKTELSIATPGRGFVPITAVINQALRDCPQSAGICNVFLRHTSASLILCENADPDVLTDLERFFVDLVPDGDPRYRHQAEGPDDMPAHVRSVLTSNSISIPTVSSCAHSGAGLCLDLGTWQGLFVYEHRYRAHQRQLRISAW